MDPRGFDGPIPFPTQYLEYFRFFNEREFFEAHETLEDLWVMETGPARSYYKGLIMMAAALFSWRRGTYGGARRLYRDGMAYLAPYPEIFEGFELGIFRRDLENLFRPLANSEGPVPAPPETSLPKLRLLATSE